MAWYLTQSVYPISDDPGNNRRLYRTDVYLNASGYNAYSGYTTNGGGSVDGQGFSWSGPSAASLSNSSQVINTSDFWIYGDANGYHGTVNASAWFDGGGGWAPGYITSSASAGGFDWDRSPTTPSYTGITRSADATYFTITYTGGVNNSGPTPSYTLQYSTDNSNWTNYTLDANNRVYLTASNQYYFRLYASNSDGTKYSTGTYGPYYGIPSAPATITAVRTKRNITVTAGTPASNGGSAITSYKVQQSTDNGVSWKTAQTMTSQSYTYTYLNAATTYLFRVYAVNAVGNGLPKDTTTGIVMPVGGKRWNGSTFINYPAAKRWSGTAWVDIQTAKKWDGTAWIDLA